MPLADFAELCGQDGPVQILPLELDEVVYPTGWPPQRMDGRTYYGIRRLDHPITNVPVTSWPAEAREYAEIDARIESVGPCGEDRRIVAEGVDALLPRAADDEPWLALRNETRELFWIELDSRRPPILVARSEPQGYPQFLVRGQHVWELRDDTILRHTLAGATLTTQTMFEDVVAMWPPSDDRRWPEHETGELLVQLETGELLAFDFLAGTSEELARNVGGFATDLAQRWIISWSVEPGTQPSDATDTATLFERGQDVSYIYGSPGEPIHRFGFERDVLVQQTGCSPGDAAACPFGGGVVSTTFVLPDELVSVQLDGDWRVWGSTQRGEFIARELATGESRLFSVVDGELTQPFAIEGGARLFEDSVVMQRCTDDGSGRLIAPPCDIISIPLSTGRAETIERDVWSEIAVPGPRWVDFHAPTPDPDQWRPDPRGDLVVFDPHTRVSSLIDRDVSPEYGALEPYDSDGVSPWHTDEIVYQVRSLRDDRTGLWRARFE